MAITRLAQKAYMRIDGMPDTLLKPRIFYDENPPNKATGPTSYSSKALTL